MRETTVTCDGCGFVGDASNQHLSQHTFEMCADGGYGKTFQLDLCESCLLRFNELGSHRVMERLLMRIIKGEIEL